MKELGIPKLIEFLVDGGDFVDICNTIFANCIDETSLTEIGILQVGSDRTEFCALAVATKGNTPTYIVGDKYSTADVDMNNMSVSYCDNRMFMPIFLRENVAMYVYGVGATDKFEAHDIAALSQIAIVIQSIASKKNFEDSLENSYKLLGEILDVVPTGIVVLDSVNKNILLMNKVAAESEAIQSAIGTGLAKHLETEALQFDEIYEEETGLWFDVKFNDIRWVNGQDVLMCTAFDVTQKVKNQLKIEYQANNDYLTGLFNRMKCERDLSEVLKETTDGQKGIVIYLDLDDFKQVNDGLGHQYGDVLLQEISSFISSVQYIQNSCYRMGGDEFVIIISPEVFPKVTEIVQQICARFALPWDLMGVEYYSTMSMGLAVFPDNGTHMQDILQKADYAMYEAKKGGKNRYLWYAECSDGDDQEREETENAFKEAVESGCEEFKVDFYDVKTVDDEMKGVAANLTYDKMGYDEIITLAEYGSLTVKIMNYMSRQLLTYAKQNNRKAYLMVEPVQILAKEAVNNFRNLAEEFQMDVSDIVICISDSAEFRDKSRAKATIELLKAYGFAIAIWDFGKGDMSLEKIFAYKADAVMVSNPGVIKALCAISSDNGFAVLRKLQ